LKAEADELQEISEDIIPDSCITIFYHISFFLKSDFDDKKPVVPIAYFFKIENTPR
jgi:hypothetical protein